MVKASWMWFSVGQRDIAWLRQTKKQKKINLLHMQNSGDVNIALTLAFTQNKRTRYKHSTSQQFSLNLHPYFHCRLTLCRTEKQQTILVSYQVHWISYTFSLDLLSSTRVWHHFKLYAEMWNSLTEFVNCWNCVNSRIGMMFSSFSCIRTIQYISIHTSHIADSFRQHRRERVAALRW